MRTGTIEELNTVLAKARFPNPEYMCTRRTMDVFYKDCGTEVASITKLLKRGKVVSEMILINPDYLPKV